MQAGLKSRLSCLQSLRRISQHKSRLCHTILPANLRGRLHLPTSLRIRWDAGHLSSKGPGSEWARGEPAGACKWAWRPPAGPASWPWLSAQLLPFRTQRSAPSARNYISRQDAGARTRTGASAMATVLSRALKLPGKELQPRDHPAPAPAPAGLGETRLCGWSRSGPGPNPGGAAGARRRAVQPTPWAGVSGARRVGDRGRGASPGPWQGGTLEARRAGAGSGLSCCDGECQRARRRLQGRVEREHPFPSVSSSFSPGLHLGRGRGGGGRGLWPSGAASPLNDRSLTSECTEEENESCLAELTRPKSQSGIGKTWTWMPGVF